MEIIRKKLEIFLLLVSVITACITFYKQFEKQRYELSEIKCELWIFKMETRRLRQKEITSPKEASNQDDALDYFQAVSNESIFLIQEIESLKRKLTNCN